MEIEACFRISVDDDEEEMCGARKMYLRRFLSWSVLHWSQMSLHSVHLVLFFNH